jgi:carbonic anhydrase/acetyltransferase-like protein (isoleucine patch superfamily)
MIRSFNGKIPKVADSAFISEAAYVMGDVEIGENSSVWPGAVIRGDIGKIKIGKNTAVEDNCVIHSGSPTLPPVADVTIGDNVIIGHGAVVNGRRIGNNILIGMNATILHDVEIGDNSIIAAGCVVRERVKIPDNSFVTGVPGEIRRKVTTEQLWWAQNSPAIYQGLAQRCKREGL